MKNKDFIKLVLTSAIYGLVTVGTIIAINISVDASSTIRPQHTELAKLALAGNTIATPENYNERVFQICIVDNMQKIPETVVVGSSRGMFLGQEITGYEDIYNNCVSGACLEDYYALIGLYHEKFGEVPKRVILETSPWVFYKNNPESRWRENGKYKQCACEFYNMINNTDISINEDAEKENPYFSFSYFRYNMDKWFEKGNDIFKEDARVSDDVNEAADYSDGTIRYNASLENESEERLAGVKATKGACTYEDSNNMVEIDSEKRMGYENLIDYLQSSGTEVLIYMQPFSVTQSYYCFDENMNPGYPLTYSYLLNLAKEKRIEIHGGFDARDFELDDIRFIDFMHLDRAGTNIVWNYRK